MEMICGEFLNVCRDVTNFPHGKTTRHGKFSLTLTVFLMDSKLSESTLSPNPLDTFLSMWQIKSNAYGKHCLHCPHLTRSVNTTYHFIHAPVFPLRDQSIVSCNFSFFSYSPLLLRDHCFLCPSLVTCYLPRLWRRERYSNHSWGANLSQVRLEWSRWTGSLTSGSPLGGAQKCFLITCQAVLPVEELRTRGTRKGVR